jgi:lipid A 3-O-deacylase
MYTPTVDWVEPVSGERPYAGWLYMTVTAHVVGPSTHDAIALTGGVTGPPSLAEAAQRAFHHFVPGFRSPLGWSHQIPFTIGIAVAYDHEQLAYAGTVGDARVADVVVLGGATTGNVLTTARAGIRGRVGYSLASPWWTPAAGRRSELEVFCVAEARVEALAHSLFLDARTLRGRVPVERISVVPEYTLGVGVRWKAVTLDYRGVIRGREYDTGPRTHAYGSIVMTVDAVGGR